MIYRRNEPCELCGGGVFYNSELNELKCVCGKSFRTIPKRTLEKYFYVDEIKNIKTSIPEKRILGKRNS